MPQVSVNVSTVFPHLEVGDVSFPSSVIADVLESDPELVGLSCWLWDVDAMLDLASRIKAEKSSVKIITGGPAATARARSILEGNEAVDIVVRGEGEVPLAMLLDRGLRQLRDIPGIAFRLESGQIHEPEPFFFDELSELPSPFTGGFVEPSGKEIFVEIARGCPHRCAYCHRRGTPRRVRAFPLERVEEDLRWARDRDIGVIRLIGRSFWPESSLLRQIASSAGKIYEGGEFRLAINMDNTPPRINGFDTLGDIPFDVIRCSVNTTNPRSLKLINRRQRNLEQLKEVLRCASEISRVGVDVMMGLPGDDYESFKATLDWVLEANRELADEPWEVVVNWVIAVPGSPLADDPAAFGIRRINTPGIPYILETDSYSFGDIQRSIEYVFERQRETEVILKGQEVAKTTPAIGALFDRLDARSRERRVATPGEPHLHDAITERVTALFDGLEERGWHLEGYTLETEGVVMHFTNDTSAHMDVLIAPRDDTREAYMRTKMYNISYLSHDGIPDLAFLESIARLMDIEESP